MIARTKAAIAKRRAPDPRDVLADYWEADPSRYLIGAYYGTGYSTVYPPERLEDTTGCCSAGGLIALGVLPHNEQSNYDRYRVFGLWACTHTAEEAIKALRERSYPFDDETIRRANR